MKKKFRVYLLSVLSAAILTTLCVQDVWSAPEQTELDDTPHILNYRDIEPEIEPESVSVKPSGRKSQRLRSETIPSKYGFDSISGYMPSLRDQNPFGTCWAMSSMSLAQINLQLKGKCAPDLSPVHLAYFSYNSVPDPLGGTENDKNSAIYSKPGENYMGLGGNLYFATNVLASWTGAADEKGELVYPETATSYPKTLSPSLAYDDYAHLVGSRIVYLKGENEDTALAKRLIMNTGGLGVSFYSPNCEENAVKDKLYNPSTLAFYDSKDWGRTNHAVVIVGWDDTFSKDNFVQKPDNDGAWLVRNSWAKGSISDNKGLYGYFWMSYENKSLRDSAFAFDFDYSNNYGHNYQYDLAMADTYLSNDTDELSAANVFTSKGREVLKAVSFYTNNSNVDYMIKIYKDGIPEGNDIDFDSLQPIGEATTGSTDAAGYYTVPLNAAVALNPGERFAVVVNLRKAGHIVDIQTECSDKSDWYDIVASADAGQSYFKNSSGWYDYGVSSHRNIRIKAFTDDRTDTSIDLNAATTDVIVADMDYTGAALEPVVTVKSGSVILDSSEYKVEYSNNYDVGKGTATVTPSSSTSKCYGSRSVEFDINPAPLSKSDFFTVSTKSSERRHNIIWRCYSVVPAYEIAKHYILNYNGIDLIPEVDYTVRDPEDFHLASEDPVSITLDGKGNFTGEYKIQVLIDATDIDASEDTGYQSTFVDTDFFYFGSHYSIPDQYYDDGKPVKPEVLNLKNKTIGDLEPGKDYTIKEYQNNTEPGTGKVIVEGIGCFTGTKVCEFNIVKALSLTIEQKDPVTYNGSEQPINVKLTGNVDTDKIVIKYCKTENGTYSTELPKFKDADNHRVYYKATAAAAGCANEVSGDFIFTIDPKQLTVGWGSVGSWKYDGDEHGVSPTLDGVVSGDSVILKTESLHNINAGDYTARIKSLDGDDKKNYKLPSEGLTKAYSIARRSITITSRSASGDYTGNELKCEEYDVTGDGFYGEEGVNVVFTGGRTAPGESDNEFTYTFKDNTRASNYETPVCKFGKLTVGWWPDDKKDRHVITVSALDKTVEYNGSVQTVSGFDEDTLVQIIDDEVYDVTGLSAEGSGTNVGSYPNTITGTATVWDSEDHDVTSHFMVQFDHGVLVIKAKNLSGADISLGDDLYYNGSEQTQSFSVKVDGRTLSKGTDYEVSGDKATSSGDHTLTITGKGGYTGSASKTYTIKTGKLTGVSVSQSDTMTYTGSAQQPKVKTSADQSDVTFTYATSSGSTYTSSMPSFTKAGTYKVYYRAEKSGYTSETGSFDVTVKKAVIGIRWGSETSFSYDGKNHVPTCEATGVLGSDSIKLTVTGAASKAGTYTAKVTGMSGTGSENYELSSDNREKSFTITGSSKNDSGSSSNTNTNTNKTTTTTTNTTKSNTTKTTTKSTTKSTTNTNAGTSTANNNKKTTTTNKSTGSNTSDTGSKEKTTDSDNKTVSKDDKDKTENKTDKDSKKDSKKDSGDEIKLADNEAALKAALGEEKFKELKESGELPQVRLESKVLDKVPDKEQKIVEDSIVKYSAEIPNLAVGECYDISLEMNEGGEWVGIKKTNGAIQLVFKVSKEIMDKAAAEYILRIHEGEPTLLYDTDDDPETVTVDSDGFSTYVMMYQEKTQVAEAPASAESETKTVAAVESAPDTGSANAAPAAIPESSDSEMWRIWAFIGILVLIGGAVVAGIKIPQMKNKK